jgi:CubicO group peptidase (beta-lactamase class C family)
VAASVGPRRVAPSELGQSIDAYIEPLVRSRDFAGAVLVARADRVLFEKGYGLANAELDVPNGPATVFRIASITKTFTAAAIVMLVERGVVRYADPLSKYLPEFPNGDHITIEHLLLHQSGVANPSYETIATARVSLSELIDSFKNKPLLFAPGTRTQYSNAGYVLLAAVIERASGLPYAEFLRRNITTPLRMASTVPDRQEGTITNRASGYVPGPPPSGLENVAWYDMSPFAGSGSLVSTVRDLHRWARAVHRDELYRRTTLTYPYGWGVRKYFNRDLIEQSGTIDGFTSYLGIYFHDSTYVVCLTNVESSLNERCGKDVAAMVFGEPYERAAATPPPTATASVTAADTGLFAVPGFGTFRLFFTAGIPYVRWITARSAHYVAPVGRDSLFVRADRSVIVLERDSTGRTTAVTRVWPEAPPVRFPRIPGK